MEVKEEQIESENNFFKDSEGTEQLFISYENVEKDIVKNELHEIYDNYQDEDAEHKTFKCKVCDASYTLKQALDHHNGSIHEGKKPLECKLCSATLASKRGLVLHNKAVHEGTKFDCKFCEKTFSFSTNIKKHISSVHEGRRQN